MRIINVRFCQEVFGFSREGSRAYLDQNNLNILTDTQKNNYRFYKIMHFNLSFFIKFSGFPISWFVEIRHGSGVFKAPR